VQLSLLLYSRQNDIFAPSILSNRACDDKIKMDGSTLQKFTYNTIFFILSMTVFSIAIFIFKTINMYFQYSNNSEIVYGKYFFSVMQ